MNRVLCLVTNLQFGRQNLSTLLRIFETFFLSCFDTLTRKISIAGIRADSQVFQKALFHIKATGKKHGLRAGGAAVLYGIGSERQQHATEQTDYFFHCFSP